MIFKVLVIAIIILMLKVIYYIALSHVQYIMITSTYLLKMYKHHVHHMHTHIHNDNIYADEHVHHMHTHIHNDTSIYLLQMYMYIICTHTYIMTTSTYLLQMYVYIICTHTYVMTTSTYLLQMYMYIICTHTDTHTYIMTTSTYLLQMYMYIICTHTYIMSTYIQKLERNKTSITVLMCILYKYTHNHIMTTNTYNYINNWKT